MLKNLYSAFENEIPYLTLKRVNTRLIFHKVHKSYVSICTEHTAL